MAGVAAVTAGKVDGEGRSAPRLAPEAASDSGVTETVWVAALIPGDPLMTSARRLQDALASAGLSVAHALPPVVPVAALSSISGSAAVPAVTSVLATLHGGCVADDLAVQTALRTDALRAGALRGSVSRVVLPLANPTLLEAITHHVESLTASQAASGVAAAALGRADGLLLAPGAPSQETSRAVRHAPTRADDGVLASRRWQAAVLCVEYSAYRGATSWAWQLLGSRKLRRWWNAPGDAVRAP